MNISVAKESLKEARVNANRLMRSLYSARYATSPSDPNYSEIDSCQNELASITRKIEEALAGVENRAKPSSPPAESGLNQ